MSAAPAAVRSWGWHRLDSRWARDLVARAGITPDDLVLDVGAGDGALTAPLAATGARVIAFELHPARVATLRARFARSSRVRVVRADASDLRLPRQPFRVVANPPFSITTGLLKRLLAPASRLERADLVLPRAYAARWAGGRGPGAARWGATFDARLDRPLPRAAFSPTAPMDVAVLVIERRAT